MGCREVYLDGGNEMADPVVEIGDAFRRGQPVITMQNLSPSVKALLNTPNSLMPVDKRGNLTTRIPNVSEVF